MLCHHCKEDLKKFESYIYANSHYHLACLTEKGRTKKQIDKSFELSMKETQQEWDFDELMQHISRRYDAYIPKFAIKLRYVINGERKNCSKISASELFEMYTKLNDVLNKSNSITDIEHKFNYELVVVIDHYAKYRSWKNKQDVFAIEDVAVADVIKNKRTKSVYVPIDTVEFKEMI